MDQPAPEPLQQLAARAAAGDRAALEPLVRLVTPRLRAFLRARVRSSDDADDLLADTWAAVVAGLPGYDPARPFQGYAFGIAAHKSADYHRDRRRRPPPAPITDDVPGDAPGPDCGLLEREIVERFPDCWARVPPDRRRLFLLRFPSCTTTSIPASVDDLAATLSDRVPYEEVARRAGRAAGDVAAVRSALWRTVNDLLVCLGVPPDGDDPKNPRAGERRAAHGEEPEGGATQRGPGGDLRQKQAMTDPLTPAQWEQLLAEEELGSGLRELLSRSPTRLAAAARVVHALRLAADLAAADEATEPVPADLLRRIFEKVGLMDVPNVPNSSDEMRLRSLAIMFTDLSNSTAFAQRYGSVPAFAKRQVHNRLLLPLVERHRGTLIKVIGDALMVTFDDPADAARCAIDMQRRLREHNQAIRDEIEDADQEIHIRIGVHWGKAILFQEFGRPEVSGAGANTAARVESAGGKQTDQVLLSEATVAKLLPHGGEFATEPAGTFDAKGVGEMRIFRLLWREQDAAAGTSVSNAPAGAQAPMQALAAQTAILSPDQLAKLEDTRAVHCLFIDPATSKAYARPVWVQVKPAAAGSIRPRVECDRIMRAAATRAVEAAFAVLRRLGFRDADPARHAIEWWVEGPPAEYQGASLGLGLALAAAAAYAGAPLAAGVVVTGATDGERVVHVEGIEHKWEAVRDAGQFDTMVLPASDVPRLPPAARHDGKIKLLPIDGIEDAVVDLLGPSLGLSARRLAAAVPAASVGGVDLQLWVQPAEQRGLRRDIEVVAEDDTHSWRVGDKVRVCVSADRDCHVAVINLGSSGKVTVLLPNSRHPDTHVRAGEVASFPLPTDKFSFRLTGPPGRERLIALASDEPLKLTPADFDQSGQLVAQPSTRDIEIVADEVGDAPLGRAEIEFFVSE